MVVVVVGMSVGLTLQDKRHIRDEEEDGTPGLFKPPNHGSHYWPSSNNLMSSIAM